MYLLPFRSRCLGSVSIGQKHREFVSPKWLYRLSFSLFAFFIVTSILCVTLYSKFESGGWMTIVITCAVITICLMIKKHYHGVNQKLAELDAQLKQPITETKTHPLIPDPKQPTAVIFVGKSFGVGMHTLLCVLRIFPRHFKNFIFISVGIVDVESYTASIALDKMKAHVNEVLQYFVDYCQQYGIAAESYCSFGTDTVEQLIELAEKVSEKYPNSIFFSSKLIFEHDSWITRILHNETPNTMQRYLHLQGKELVILPMKI